MSVTNEQFRVEPNEDQVEHLGRSWRRYSSAVDAMAEAVESEDYQAVGIRCREALLALGREHVNADWIRLPDERPKDGDAKAWMRIYADSLSAGRVRDYMRALCEKTWDLTVWLQHYANATDLDAEIVLGATQQLFRAYALLMRRHRFGTKERCPECDSYQLMEDFDEEFTVGDGRVGRFFWDVCQSCGWESEKEWDNWTIERLRRMADYIDGKWSPPKRSIEELDPGDD